MNKSNTKSIRSLRLGTKVTLSVAIVQIVLLSIAAWLYIGQLQHDNKKIIEWRSQTITKNLQKRVVDLSGYTAKMQQTLGLNIDCHKVMKSNTEQDITHVGVIGIDGTIITYTDASAWNDIRTNTLLSDLFKSDSIQTLNTTSSYHVLIPVLNNNKRPVAAIDIGISKKSIDDTIFNIVLYTGISFFIFLLLSFGLISILLKHFVTNPVTQLSDAAQSFAQGSTSVTLSINRSDEVGYLAESFINMHTTIKKQIDDLNETRNYLTNIINSMPSILIGVDTEGTITQWNDGAIMASGVASNNAVGFPLKTIYPPLVSEMPRILEAIATRKEQFDPKRFSIVNGQHHYEDLTIFPLIANGIQGAVIRIDDATHRVKLEEMMIQSEKMLSLGGLAAGMAHEINNPLAGIIQNTNNLKNRLTNFELAANKKMAEDIGLSLSQMNEYLEKREVVRMIDTITEAGNRATTIITNMLNFSRKNDNIRSSEDVPHMLDTAIELAESDYDLKKSYDFKTIRFIREYEEDLPLVPCEVAKIHQVLLNILRNGAQAMSEYYEECKKTNKDSAPPTFILRTKKDQEKSMVCIEIEDNGPGIDMVTQKRIFEPFFTTKPVGTGTGLGLSVSFFIITENHDGEMIVESTPGTGTKFVIRLPIG
ncbi:MAG: ATP-binding protein [Fibrobacterales bacterium]